MPVTPSGPHPEPSTPPDPEPEPTPPQHRPRGSAARRPARSSPAADLAAVVVFAAFIAVLGLFPGVPVGAAGVPIVLQNIGPLLAGAILGARRGTASVALLLALTALGLPLLSGGRGGLAPFVGPAAGFLFGWLLSAFVTGLIAHRALRRTGARRPLPFLLLATFAGLVADYAVGVPFLWAYTGDARTAVLGSLVFVPGDLVKVVLAAVVAALVHRALPGRWEPVPER